LFEYAIWFNDDGEPAVRKKYSLEPDSMAFDTAVAAQPGYLGGMFSLGAAVRYCAGEPEFHFLGTELLGVVGSDEFHWASKVLVTTPYSGPRSLLGDVAGRENRPSYTRALEVVVEWRANVDSFYDFSDIGIIGIRHDLDLFTANTVGGTT
jgi:hypothetical protein